MHLRITSQQLAVDALPEGTASIDVCFDGARVWSIDVRDRGGSTDFPWPPALRPYLTGRTTLGLLDSATGAELASEEVSFDGAPHRTQVVDGSGAQLVLNKWGRLGVALEAMGGDVQRLILERSKLLVEELQRLGLRPFVVGGTLLGGVRAGTLLPHDDDADIAYLSEHTNPADVAAEAFGVGRRLQDLGYEIKRHSATHMQLLFRDAAGAILHYIDVFSAFFTPDGCINQPFHVRGPMREDQMLPLGRTEIDGSPFPAPADTDRWLTINYDEHWREPIPGFRLDTPLPTRRRFENWFGSFNFGREFWDGLFAQEQTAVRWQTGRSWLLEQATSSGFASTLVDLGCGQGGLSLGIATAAPDRRVIGLDYSEEALASAARALRDAGADPAINVSFAHLNVYRMRSLEVAKEHRIRGAFDLVANHVLEQIGHHGRAYAWRIIRMALRSGGTASFTFYAAPAPDVAFEDPTGWHLDEERLSEEAAAFGLVLEFVPLDGGPTERDRRPTGAMASLGPRTPDPTHGPRERAS